MAGSSSVFQLSKSILRGGDCQALSQTVLEQGGHFAGINRKVQLKPVQWIGEEGNKKITEALLILKHGGVLTHAGRQQASSPTVPSAYSLSFTLDLL